LIDHAKYAKEYIKAGFPVGISQGTADALHLDGMILKSGYWYKFGGFTVTTFRTEHDCVEPLGFLIEHADFGRLLFITDSAFVKPNFKTLNINHILIEANYSETIIVELLSKGLIDQARVNRTFKTHMSIETCLKFLEVNKTTNLDNVVLLHMSDGNSNATQFVEAAKKVVGNNTKVYEAKPGLTVKLDLFPFA
jgi:phosphoribosyl 1,2-cyclic phosphodiesterase